MCLLPILTLIRHNSIQAKILKRKGEVNLQEPTYLEKVRENRNRILVGSQWTIMKQLTELQNAYSVDEFMIASLAPDNEQKVEGYRL